MKSKKGMTLVELIIAMAIFAIISTAIWAMFDYVGKANENNQRYMSAKYCASYLGDIYETKLLNSKKIVIDPANTFASVPTVTLEDKQGYLLCSRDKYFVQKMKADLNETVLFGEVFFGKKLTPNVIVKKISDKMAEVKIRIMDGTEEVFSTLRSIKMFNDGSEIIGANGDTCQVVLFTPKT